MHKYSDFATSGVDEEEGVKRGGGETVNGRQRGQRVSSGTDCSGTGYSKVEWSDMVLFCKDISVQFFPAMNLLVSLILKTKKPWTNI